MTKTHALIYELKELKVNENNLQATLYIPENLIHFDGHFEKTPILPGVVQTHWAIKLAAEHLKISGNFKSIDVIKFTKIIPPASTIELNIIYNPTKNAIEFQYNSEIGQHSSGKVSFA